MNGQSKKKKKFKKFCENMEKKKSHSEKRRKTILWIWSSIQLHFFQFPQIQKYRRRGRRNKQRKTLVLRSASMKSEIKCSTTIICTYYGNLLRQTENRPQPKKKIEWGKQQITTATATGIYSKTYIIIMLTEERKMKNHIIIFTSTILSLCLVRATILSAHAEKTTNNKTWEACE